MPRKKRLSLHSIAFACTMIAALLTGIWFLFPVKEWVQEYSPQVVQFWEQGTEPPSIPVAVPDLPEALPLAEVQEEEAAAAEAEEKEVAVAELEEEAVAAGEEVLADAKECEQAAATLAHFFQAAAQEKAVHRLQLTQGLDAHLAALVEQLVASPPQVIRETDNLHTILANITHLYRILGPQNTYLLQELSVQGQAQQEDLAAALYRQTVDIAGCSSPPQLHFPLEAATQYAGFFLYTMGGRSYLFRRDARVRLLLTYYAVLVLDQAQQEGLAIPLGDLGQIIANLQGEMKANQQLLHRESYIERLQEVSSRFPAPQ